METNDKDKLLKDFFSGHKQEIADNGFTQRVMRRLPEQTDKGWIVWIFAAIGMAISIYLGITFGLVENILTLMKQVSIYYILAGIFCLPLLGTAGFFFTQNKDYRVI
ncbi:MAG: DUF5056 domain-containing protein [Paludibacter sp.]|nr:DUF5056 domain-containing protein [Paludibacter sp.]